MCILNRLNVNIYILKNIIIILCIILQVINVITDYSFKTIISPECIS